MVVVRQLLLGHISEQLYFRLKPTIADFCRKSLVESSCPDQKQRAIHFLHGSHKILEPFVRDQSSHCQHDGWPEALPDGLDLLVVVPLESRIDDAERNDPASR